MLINSSWPCLNDLNEQIYHINKIDFRNHCFQQNVALRCFRYYTHYSLNETGQDILFFFTESTVTVDMYVVYITFICYFWLYIIYIGHRCLCILHITQPLKTTTDYISWNNCHINFLPACREVMKFGKATNLSINPETTNTSIFIYTWIYILEILCLRPRTTLGGINSGFPLQIWHVFFCFMHIYALELHKVCKYYYRLSQTGYLFHTCKNYLTFTVRLLYICFQLHFIYYRS